MRLIIQKADTLNGCIQIPGSKSQSIRSLMFSLLAQGSIIVHNFLHSDDTHDALQNCEKLGLKVKKSANTLEILSSGIPLLKNPLLLHTGNSGITTHFLLPILGLRKDAHIPVVMECHTQMQARSIQDLTEGLNQLGMTIEYLNSFGKLPLRVRGYLKGGEVELNGMTSQPLSALLISLPLANKNSRIIVRNLNERPYVEMTLQWLREQNIQFTHEFFDNIDQFQIVGGQTYQPFVKNIAGDFSSASYFFAASALIQGQVSYTGLDIKDTQGDSALLNILKSMGASVDIDGNNINIKKNNLKGIAIDANQIPDLLPTLAILGTRAAGKTHIFNVPHARLKETDRIHSLYEGLVKLGAKVAYSADSLTIYESTLRGNHVHGYGDHRTVMALTLAGLLAEGETVVSDGDCVSKTFPDFIQSFRKLGATIAHG